MSTPLTWPGGLTDPTARPITLLAAAWRAMTPKHAFYTFLLCTAWSVIEVVSATSNFSRDVSWGPPLNSFLSMQFNGFAVMFAVLIADGASRPPLHRWWPYVLAVVVGVALATTLFWFVSQRVFTIPSAIQVRGLPEGFDTIVFRHSTSRLAICGLAAYVYVCWRFAGQRLAALRAVQLERVATEKRVLETRLAFTQSRVAPQFLSNTLMQIERLYEIDAPAGDRVLKELILYLRAAIPQIDNPASTVAREFQLTNAYLNIVGLQSKSYKIALA